MDSLTTSETNIGMGRDSGSYKNRNITKEDLTRNPMERNIPIGKPLL